MVTLNESGSFDVFDAYPDEIDVPDKSDMIHGVSRETFHNAEWSQVTRRECWGTPEFTHSEMLEFMGECHNCLQSQ